MMIAPAFCKQPASSDKATGSQYVVCYENIDTGRRWNFHSHKLFASQLEAIENFPMRYARRIICTFRIKFVKQHANG